MGLARREAVRHPDAAVGTCKYCGLRCDPGRRTHDECKRRQVEGNQYRETAAKREGVRQRCVDCGKLAGDTQWVRTSSGGLRRQVVVIERDHPKRLADYGPRGHTVPRCKRCHTGKTAMENRKTKGNKTMGKTRAWGWNIVGALFVLAGVWWFLRSPGTPTPRAPHGPRLPSATSLLVMVVAVVILVGLFLAWKRMHTQRRARLRALADLLAAETNSDPGKVRMRASEWAKGVPVAGEFSRYSTYFKDGPGSKDRERVEEILRTKIGRISIVWDPPRDTVRWSPAADGDTVVEPEVHPETRRRVEAAVRAEIKGDVDVTWDPPDDNGDLTAFTVAYPSTFRDGDDVTRANLFERVSAKIPGRWKAEWDTHNDRVRFRLRPPMPSLIENPVLTNHEDTWRIPIGPGDDGNEVVWNLRNAPHALICGPTGSGKTVLLRSMIVDATILGFAVFCLDPKRIELTGLRGWPGVRVVASRIEQMIALVDMLADEMEARYAAIEDGLLTENDLPPVLMVMDEMTYFIKRANAYWKQNKKQGQTGSEHPVIQRWRDMAALGRSGRMHLVVGTQRPDSDVLGGDARDNFEFRFALGNMSDQGARMMFGRADLGRGIPKDAKGRGTAGIGDDVIEVQSYYTPNPRELKSDREGVHLGMLQAAAAEHASTALQHLNAGALAERVAETMGDPKTPTRTRTRPAVEPVPVPQWEPVPVTGLHRDDVIEVDVDGTKVVATLLAAPVETDDDPTLREVVFRREDGTEDGIEVDQAAMFPRRRLAHAAK